MEVIRVTKKVKKALDKQLAKEKKDAAKLGERAPAMTNIIERLLDNETH